MVCRQHRRFAAFRRNEPLGDTEGRLGSESPAHNGIRVHERVTEMSGVQGGRQRFHGSI